MVCAFARSVVCSFVCLCGCVFALCQLSVAWLVGSLRVSLDNCLWFARLRACVIVRWCACVYVGGLLVGWLVLCLCGCCLVCLVAPLFAFVLVCVRSIGVGVCVCWLAGCLLVSWMGVVSLGLLVCVFVD